MAEAPDDMAAVGWYRLGWVAYNEGSCKEALSSFEEAIDRSPEAPGDAAAARVARDALVDATFCYAQVGEPDEAAGWIRSRARTRGDHIAALERLTRRYAVLERAEGVAPVLRTLLAMAPDAPERVDDIRLLHRSLVRSKDFRHVGEDVATLLTVLDRRTALPELDDETRDTLRTEVLDLAHDLSLRAQRVLTDDGEGRTDAVQTAAAWTRWLAMADDDPRRVDALRNLADAHDVAGHPLEAGRAWAAAAELLDEAEADEARFEAAVAFQDATDADALLARREARAALRDIGGDWLTRHAGEPEAERIALAIGRSWIDDGHTTRARDHLTATAMAWPGTAESEAAVVLVLDSYDAAGDLDGMLAASTVFLADDSPVASHVRARIGPLVATAEQRRLDELSLAASGDGTDELDQLLGFVERYEGSDLGERALVNAFVAARADGDAALAAELGEALLERFPSSEQASGVAATLAQVATARYELDTAATWLTRAASASADPGDAASAWSSLAALQQTRGDLDGAVQAATRAHAKAPSEQTLLQLIALADERQDARKLASLADSHPAARLAYAHTLLRTGDLDEAATQAAAARASTDLDLGARAAFVLADARARTLEASPIPGTLASLQEEIATVDALLQLWIDAAQVPDTRWRQAALARLAETTELAASRLREPVPADIPDAQRDQVAGALTARADQLELNGAQARATCVEAARAAHLFDAVSVACLTGSPTGDLLAPTRLTAGKTARVDLDEARSTLADDPEDPDALRALGLALHRAGDPVTARLVLTRLCRDAPLAEDLVALGDANLAAGDLPGALSAYARAHALGLDTAERRFQEALSRAGMPTIPLTPLQAAHGGTR